MAEKKKKLTKAEKQAEYNQMVYDNWQVNRAKGRMNFVIKFGVISWGFFTFVVYWAIMLLLNGLLKMGAPATPQLLLITGVGFVVAGIVYGNVLWHRNEKIFLKRFPYGRTK